MAKRTIAVELDEETIRPRGALGEQIDVITQLAAYGAAGGRRPDRKPRHQTNQNLRIDRDMSDEAMAPRRESLEAVADDVVRAARERADRITETARAVADS